MKTNKMESFKVIGISVRTTNENGQSGTDIPALWARFMADAIMEKIPNKIGQSLYCIYTEYEKDHTKPYTTILGCRVDSLENIPAGLMGREFAGGNYEKRTTIGNINEGIVFDEWTKIWSSDLPRAFTADFEVYDERAQNPDNAEVDIFVALR